MSDNPNLSFFIEGTPAPGGSKTFFPMWDRAGKLVTTIRNGRVWPIIRVVDDAGEGNKRWKEAVAIQAKSFMRGARPFDIAMKIELVFFLKRPLKHFGTGKNASILKSNAPVYHTQVPDALKLARSTEDAMTGIIYLDDSSNVRICSEKRWCNVGEKPGCAVRIVLIPSAPPTQSLLV